LKILFDQNISYRVVKKIQNIFPGSVQVREIGLENATDKEIWDFAKNNSYSIITFDSDFSSFSILYSHPPKVIWLRIGNVTTDALINFLESHAETITEFLTSANYASMACLELE